MNRQTLSSYGKHCIDVLKHGKHVACAVPAVWSSLEDAERLYDAVKTTGRQQRHPPLA